MRNKKKLLLFAFIFFVLYSLVLPTPQKSDYPPQEQKPPVDLLKCIDIEVNSITATLISTQINDPSVEIPHDTVRLRVVLKNVGGLPLPPASMSIYFYKNFVNFQTPYFHDILQAKGSSFETTITDSFPHGVKTTYSVYYQVDAFSECTTKNNKASITIDEVKLHQTKPRRNIKR